MANDQEHPKYEDERHAWIAEIEQKQRNLVWPDAMRNSRGVDALFFKGDPTAPMIQRIGCWVFGCSMFFATATALAVMAETHIRFFAVPAIATAVFGGWVFSRGFVGLRKKH